MTIKDYIFITQSGITEKELLDYFKIDQSQTIDKVSADLKIKIKIPVVSQVKRYIRIGNTIYKIDKNIAQLSYEQFNRLETLLAEGDNVSNLHKLLSIYVRPINWYGGIQKYNFNKQEKIYDKLLNMDIGVANSIIQFFFLNAVNYMKNINISYLNQMKKMEMEYTQNKSMK